MGKFALLIGVSKYESSNLCTLTEAENDVRKMEEVLLHSEMCGFSRENVKLLLNPNFQAMREDIYWLFNQRRRDDLILLYLAGHGLRDRESGNLYFASSTTRENALLATSVDARFVHTTMTDSHSESQIIILDCCYSGAFSNGMLARSPDDININVDIQQYLGGKGRAVLTSSASLQPTVDGVYTTYLVQGIKTGAADEDNDGWIKIRELHNYTKKQVQISAPTMQPEIYTTQEGYDITLSRSPIGDPKLKYIKELEKFAETTNGCTISSIGRRTLTILRGKLGLSVDETKEIENQFFQPCQERENNLQTYREVFEQEYPLNPRQIDEIKFLQQSLGLRDEDVQPIEEEIINSYQLRLCQYKNDFREAIKNQYPLNQNTHAELRQSSNIRKGKGDLDEIEENVLKERQEGLQKYEQEFRQGTLFLYPFIDVLGTKAKLTNIIQSFNLGNQDIKKIESRLKYQIISFIRQLILLLLLIFCMVWIISKCSPPVAPPNPRPSQPQNKDIQNKISVGDKNLFKGKINTSPEVAKLKEEGISEFNKPQPNYQAASQKFEQYLAKHSNDPEALIYKNNADARAKGNPITIATSVPIGSNASVAMEMLRGIAQAQDELNKLQGINDRLLEVVIGDDSNKAKDAEQIAQKFVNYDTDKKILAVVGSNAIKPSLAAAKVYENTKMIMISPTSFAEGFLNYDANAFQLFSDIDAVTQHLAENIKNLTPENNILVCGDDDSGDNKKFIKSFLQYVKTHNAIGKINDTPCSLNVDNQDFTNILKKAKKDRANILLLAPHIDKIPLAIKLAEANKSLGNDSLILLGSPTMNTFTTIDKTNAPNVIGMRIAVPWDMKIGKGKDLRDKAYQTWGGDINWRTAMSYDATNAIIEVLKTDPERQVSPEQLRNQNLQGATGEIQFRDKRKLSVSLIKVEEEPNNSKTPYIFDPIRPPN